MSSLSGVDAMAHWYGHDDNAGVIACLRCSSLSSTCQMGPGAAVDTNCGPTVTSQHRKYSAGDHQCRQYVTFEANWTGTVHLRTIM